jgi:hypothetical protein
MTDSFLTSLVGNRNFSWNALSAVGTARGQLCIDNDFHDIHSWNIRNFCVSCFLRFEPKGIDFRVILVYGSPYEEGKEEFISELNALFMDSFIPTLICGDFNLVRFQTDKIKGNANQKWCDKFNAWVEIWSLLKFQVGDIPGQTTKRT